MCLIYLTCGAYFKKNWRQEIQLEKKRIFHDMRWDQLYNWTNMCVSILRNSYDKLSNQDYKICRDIDSMSSEDVLWSLERNIILLSY
jgi:hypothetical protein